MRSNSVNLGSSMLSSYCLSPGTDAFRPMRPKNARITMEHRYFRTRQLWTRWIEHDSTSPRCLHVKSGALCKPCFRGFVAGSVSRRQEELSSTIEKATLEYKENLRWGTAEQQGPRESMEDAVHVVENGRCGFFFASVFDGHAGYAAAQFLQKNLYNVFNEMIDTHSLGLDCNIAERTEGLCCPLHLHGVLTDCYARADSALLTWLADQSDDQCESGCTATTALVCNDRIIVANVGDSRAVLCRNGESIDLSTEHRVYGRGPAVGSEIARIKSAGGWIEEGRVCGILAVSRAFGDSNFKGEGLKRLLAQGTEDGYWDDSFASSVTFTANPVIAEPDVFEIGLLPGQDEFLIVATDGLWDVMSSKEVVKVARSDFLQGRHPQEVAQRLASFALKKYTADNVAVVVIDLSGEEKWKMDGEKSKASKGLFGLWKSP